MYGCAGSSSTAAAVPDSTTCAGVHDGDVVADVGDHAEVVADDDHRQAGVADQRAQQAEDLGLHGDVEGGGGLVGDQQLRLAGERQRDADALRHAAGQLVRVALQHPLGVDDADLAAAARRRSASGLAAADACGTGGSAGSAGRRRRTSGPGRPSAPGRSSRSPGRGCALSSFSDSPTSSRPCQRIEPPDTETPSGSRPISERAVIVLPQPDSPDQAEHPARLQARRRRR